MPPIGLLKIGETTMTAACPNRVRRRLPRLAEALVLAGACAAPLPAVPVMAQEPPQAPAVAQPTVTFADLATLTEAASIVALVEVRKQAVVEPERAPGLQAGHARLYIEARTEALLAGRTAIGEALAYLVDVPFDAKGKVPKLKKQRFLVFANRVPGKPGQLQLVDPSAQLAATAANEQFTRTMIGALAATDAPPRVSGVGNAMSVRGNLAGESETQIFLETKNGDPVSLSVVRRPGMEPQWGVSWSEIVDQSAQAPQTGTLDWYRLACSLPTELPGDAFLQDDTASRRQASEDYRFIIEQLGPCARQRA
jgi:hypothetical protein